MFDLHDFLFRRYGVSNILVHPVVSSVSFVGPGPRGNEDVSWDVYRKAMYSLGFDYYFKMAMQCENPHYVSAVSSKVQELSRCLQEDRHCGCGSGSDSMTLFADGTLFPCYTMTGNSNLCMGHVLQSEPDLAGSMARAHRTLARDQKSREETCKSCALLKTCHYCSGEMLRQDTLHFAVPYLCDYQFGVTEGLLLGAHQAGFQFDRFIPQESHV